MWRALVQQTRNLSTVPRSNFIEAWLKKSPAISERQLIITEKSLLDYTAKNFSEERVDVTRSKTLSQIKLEVDEYSRVLIPFVSDFSGLAFETALESSTLVLGQRGQVVCETLNNSSRAHLVEMLMKRYFNQIDCQDKVIIGSEPKILDQDCDLHQGVTKEALCSRLNIDKSAVDSLKYGYSGLVITFNTLVDEPPMVEVSQRLSQLNINHNYLPSYNMIRLNDRLGKIAQVFQQPMKEDWNNVGDRPLVDYQRSYPKF